MATQIQLRRGTLEEHESFTGAVGEVTVDTTNNRLRVHDGSTVGGHELGGHENTTVDNVSSLTATLALSFTVAIVKDTDRGGIFVYDATQSGVDNGGTVFNGWVRQYDGAVNVKWFGAKGDGVTDDTTAFISTTNSVPDKEMINIPTGDYNITSAGGGEYFTTGIVSFTNLVPRILFGLTNEQGKAMVRRNYNAGRDELQIYSSGDAYSTNSLGSGIHLYGNNDTEHAGNIALLTGNNDEGQGRVIVGGGGGFNGRDGATTRVTIANSGTDLGGHAGVTNIWDYVDENHDEDSGMLNLLNPIDSPAIYIQGASEAGGDIAADSADILQLGHWDTSTKTFISRFSCNVDGTHEFGEANTGTFTVGVFDDSSGGNQSATTGTGYWSRIGNVMNIQFKLSNIDITGMTGGSNAYFRETAVVPSSNNFTLASASNNCPLQLYGSDIDFNSKDALIADIGTTGNITIREWTSLAGNVISNVSQVDGADIYVSGSFIVG